MGETATIEMDQLTLERVPDLGAVRADWMRLAAQSANVFGTWEWVDAWYRHLGGGAELAVAVARRPDGQAVAILPVCVPRTQPFRLARFVGAGPSDALGAVCAPGDLSAAAAALSLHVRDVLAGSGLFLGERLSPADPLASASDSIPLRRAASPVLPIAGRTFDEFLASRSRNLRSQVRRHERNLSRSHRLAYRLTQEPDRLEEDMRTLIRLHAARWRGERTIAFGGRRAQFHLDFAARALENGWLRLWTMELDGTPVAAWYGLRYEGTEFYYQAGRDPALDEFHVGFVLLCHSIRCAFEDGLREYRFGRGHEPYKYRFAEHDPGLETVAIAAGIRGKAALNAIRLALRMPKRLRAGAWQVGAGQRETV